RVRSACREPAPDSLRPEFSLPRSVPRCPAERTSAGGWRSPVRLLTSPHLFRRLRSWAQADPSATPLNRCRRHEPIPATREIRRSPSAVRTERSSSDGDSLLQLAMLLAETPRCL